MPLLLVFLVRVVREGGRFACSGSFAAHVSLRAASTAGGSACFAGVAGRPSSRCLLGLSHRSQSMSAPCLPRLCGLAHARVLLSQCCSQSASRLHLAQSAWSHWSGCQGHWCVGLLEPASAASATRSPTLSRTAGQSEGFLRQLRQAAATSVAGARAGIPSDWCGA